ncbi:MAG: T9SS type A sorting domain-containing protein [Bacteroidota bacterium]
MNCSYFKKRYILFQLLLFTCYTACFGAIDWKGGTSNDWNVASNWSPARIPLPTDDVHIGMVAYTTVTNQPVVTASTTVNSLTLGTVQAATLTVNSGITLSVTYNITQMHPNANVSVTANIIGQTVAGVLGGTINCGGSMYIGDPTNPPAPIIGLLYAELTNQTIVNVAIKSININQNLILNTTSSSNTFLGIVTSNNVNNPTLNFNNGSININGNIQMTNSNYANNPGFNFLGFTYPSVKNSSQLLLNPSTNATVGSNAKLSFGGTLDINADGNGAALLDFYGTGSGSSTVVYSGTGSTQTVYTAATGLDNLPSVYQNLSFSGSAAKSVQAGTITLPGNWNSAGGNIDLLTNGTSIVFSGGNQTLTDDGINGVVFGNVTCKGTGTKTLSSGKFSVANIGVLTMAESATLATGGYLTLISDATSSASVSALPSGTGITGNVNVQRFMKGSSTDLSKRGYRLISSPVYNAAPGGVNCFDLLYLLNNTYVAGMAGGGFNAPTTNPTLYLYREDIIYANNSFTSGNFKGISKINNTNAFDIGTQQRLTITNVADTTINLPVGNGVLFFFVGNLTDNATQSGSKVAAPFDYPEDVTFTQTGQLNTGTINVKPWYTSGYSLPYTNNAAYAGSNGFVLVGNPYASTINWEKFNRNSSNSSVYGGGALPAKIWVFNPYSKQYETYMQKPTVASVADTTTTVNPTGSLYTGNASNMIASGQGFFIRASATGQTLSFRESAKTNTQPTPANLIKLMNAPTANNALAFSSAPINDTAPVSNPILSFKLIKDSINTDNVVLAFNNHTDNKFSEADDAEDMNGNGALVSLSLISSDNITASIKQIKLPQKNQQIIKLLADAKSSGKYQIQMLQRSALPPAYDVWLMDNFTKDSLDIKHNNTYTFNINKSDTNTFGRNRFKIIVRENPALVLHPLSISAIKTELGAQITWRTENEADSYLFNVQKSADNGKTFNQIGQLLSNSLGTYAFLDTHPLKGENQYKIVLQNTSFNTTTDLGVAKLFYADTVAIPTPDVVLYPNPATSVVNIKMALLPVGSTSYYIKILNSSGRLVKQITSAQPSWQENITGLLPGTYIVQVINLKDNKVEGKAKFVKL